MSLMQGKIDRQTEEFATNGQMMAEAARDSLIAIARRTERQAGQVTEIISSQKTQIAGLQRQLAEERQRNATLAAENYDLMKSRQSQSESLRRLHLCFMNLVKSVEDHSGIVLGVEQRVEAMVQAQDFATETGADLNLVSDRMKAFLKNYAAEPALASQSTTY